MANPNDEYMCYNFSIALLLHVLFSFINNTKALEGIRVDLVEGRSMYTG